MTAGALWSIFRTCSGPVWWRSKAETAGQPTASFRLTLKTLCKPQNLYCLHCLQSKDAVSVTKLSLGTLVRCNAWLLDEAAKIPYLVSNLWPEEVSE